MTLGAVNYNDTTQWVEDAAAVGGSFTGGGKLDVTAVDTGFIGSFAVAGAKASNGRDPTGNRQTAVAAAVGYAQNSVTNTTRAYIRHATVNAGGNITLTSTAEPIVEALSIGGTFARGSSTGVALAGAGSVNKVDNKTEAFILGSQDSGPSSNDRRSVTSIGGGIGVNATDAAQVFAHAGAVALAFSQPTSASKASRAFSMGVSVAINEIGQRTGQAVLAYIDDSKVAAAGPIDVLATFNGKFQTLAVGGAVAFAPGGTFSFTSASLAGAAAGAYSSNVIASTIKAYVTTSSVVVTGSSDAFHLKLVTSPNWCVPTPSCCFCIC